MTHPTKALDVDLEAIKRLAEQATPGPWESEDIGAGTVACGVVASSGLVVIEHDFVSPRNAAYIAALSPDVVLRLVALAERGQQWQEPASAPSGTRVLVLTEDGEQFVAGYDDGCDPTSRWQWKYHVSRQGLTTYLRNVVGWMPLPAGDRKAGAE